MQLDIGPAHSKGNPSPKRMNQRASSTVWPEAIDPSERRIDFGRDMAERVKMRTRDSVLQL
ncbi:hypothetical protein DBV39_06705 [Orrella marina]|uniref:Uncharacterized protein n=1 Tax=Orrella marina TaxID=2163011 RepID=A0A2R4XI41_9BURK|nr:hypothetical protein DBV39_06705 [Orrella marina]